MNPRNLEKLGESHETIEFPKKDLEMFRNLLNKKPVENSNPTKQNNFESNFEQPNQ